MAGVEWESRTVTGNEVTEVSGTTASGAPGVSIADALRPALSLKLSVPHFQHLCITHSIASWPLLAFDDIILAISPSR